MLTTARHMKILLSYKFHKNMTPLGFECERALISLGHTVLRLDVDPPRPGWTLNRRTPGEDRNQVLLEQVSRHNPDLVFIVIGYNYLPKTLGTIKRKHGTKVIGWWVENPESYDALYPSLQWYDHVFSFSRNVASEISRNSPKVCHFVNYGTDPEIYHPIALSRWGRFRYESDLSFLGKFKERRLDYLRAVSDMDVGIWGPLWKKELGKLRDPLLGSVRGYRLFNRKAALLFNATKVNLNINSWPTDTGPNLRVFDVLACRSCLLTEYVEELEELFSIGEEIDTFHSGDELRDKAGYYLRNEAVRERMAARGYEKVLSTYKMSDCVRRILDIAA
jgi:spore maturation protein CgeB